MVGVIESNQSKGIKPTMRENYDVV